MALTGRTSAAAGAISGRRRREAARPGGAPGLFLFFFAFLRTFTLREASYRHEPHGRNSVLAAAAGQPAAPAGAPRTQRGRTPLCLRPEAHRYRHRGQRTTRLAAGLLFHMATSDPQISLPVLRPPDGSGDGNRAACANNHEPG